jgi:PAS domain S-box-containing protein
MPDSWADLARRASAQIDGDHASALRDQLDGLAKIATRLFAVPIARISLATPSSRILVGHAGTELADASRAGAFGADDTADPQIGFSASEALLSSAGTPVGTFCIIDTTAPREALNTAQRDDLQTLARAAMACLERWRVTQDPDERPIVPLQGNQGTSGRFETLADALPQLVWSTQNDGQSDYFSEQWCQFTGSEAAASYGTGWLDFVHPEDVPLAREAWRRAVETGEPYTVEFRLRHADGTYRWMLTRGLPVTDGFGAIARWIGTCTDIDERVRTGDLLEFMSRELSHRIKNLFSVVQSLISMALRKHEGMNEVSQALQLRMVALGHAHDLVRPRLTDGTMLRSQTTLSELIRILTLPYVQDDPSRLEIVGDDAVVNEHAATPLALFFHEMAINSTRFGALGVPGGRLRIAITVGDDVTIAWKETNGPIIAAPPEPAFGISLIKLSIERQLRGTLSMDWEPDGLHAIARIALQQLTAD